jgi:hypothetical protein
MIASFQLLHELDSLKREELHGHDHTDNRRAAGPACIFTSPLKKNLFKKIIFYFKLIFLNYFVVLILKIIFLK